MTAPGRMLQAAVSLGTIVVLAIALLLAGAPVAASTGPTTHVTIQTMDSCKRALGGTQYVLSGGSGVSITAVTPPGSPQTVGSGTCALQQGNCATMSTGCATFTGVPYPGTYTFSETVLAVGNTSNPDGYAPCNGGSACRSQMGTVSIDSSGTVQATVLNVYPDGTTVTYPIATRHSGVAWYAGTAADPVVTHNFGLAPPGYNGNPQCDGDSDADDYSTGTPSSHCQYPETQEASACQPFPWSCSLPATTTSSSSSSTTTTTSRSSTTSTTSTTTTSSTSTTSTSTTISTTVTSTGTACATQTTRTFTGSAGASSSTSYFVNPTAAGPLTATVTWSPTTTVNLIVYNSAYTVVGKISGSSGALTLALNLPLDSDYKVKVQNTGSQSITFTLSVTYC
jgi:hypothetical protein